MSYGDRLIVRFFLVNDTQARQFTCAGTLTVAENNDP